MSSPAPTPGSPIDLLRARFHRLASDKRIVLLPEGAAVMRELTDAMDELADLARRVTAIERGMRHLMAPENFGCDDS